MWLFKKKAPKTKEFSENEIQELVDKSFAKIQQFSSYIDESKMGLLEIRDVKKLPFDKESLTIAIRLLLKVGEDSALLEHVKVVGLYIAQFQEGVGTDNLLPMPDINLDDIDNEETLKILVAYDITKFQKFNAKATQERDELLSIFELDASR